MPDSSPDPGRRISDRQGECGCVVVARRGSQTLGAPVRSLYDLRESAFAALVVLHAPAKLPGTAGFDFREG